MCVRCMRRSNFARIQSAVASLFFNAILRLDSSSSDRKLHLHMHACTRSSELERCIDI